MITLTATEPLRAEHRQLLPEIERLRATADDLATVPSDSTIGQLDALLAFLRNHLIPHARAEEKVLYPEIARCLGAANATATMTADHEEVLRLIAELGEIRDGIQSGRADRAHAVALRRVLYGLYAILKLHFAKEEDLYLPILDGALTADEATTLFRRMEQSATTA
ncbi:MAG TPA: hemerythrin domain-containing protein [Gemmatimonadota bacterium]|nr:hemerythrin domain-containing protein [Gemmatimonadota bacterium]